MTRISYISIILVFAATVSVMVPAYAIPPLEQFVFQGVLKDSSGNLITGTRNIGLRLYTVSSGHTATNDANCTPPFCLWTENQTNISVSNGVFTVYAGSISPLTKVMNFTNALYMEVIIRGSPDQVLSPRISIASVPFAIAAEKASTNFDLNKHNIINASAIYASGVINGIMIDNSSQSIAGVSTLSIGTIKSGSIVAGINSTGGINGSAITVQKGSSIIASISKTGVVNGSSVQVQNNGIINDLLSTSGLTIKSITGSTVGGISSAGLVNGSGVNVMNGGITVGNINSTGGVSGTGLQALSSSGSKVGSISKTGVVNGSSVQVQNNGIINDLLSTSGLTIKSITGSTVGGISNTGTVNGSSISVQKGTSVMGSINNAGVVNGSSLQIESGSSHINIVTITSTGGITMSGANINLGANFLTNSGHQISLPSSSGTILLTNGTLSSLTGNLNSVGGIFTGTVNTATAITAPTSTNTINGIIINNDAISGVSTLTASGNITANEGLIISGGHLRTTSSTPKLSCGNGVITGTDNAGIVKLGSTIPATCTVTFASTFSSAPACIVIDTSNLNTNVAQSSSTNTALSFSGNVGPASGDKIVYLCIGQP
ncbi:MAG: hypothetical protein KGH88_08705 [Thaumarchaeota archaeon]|nr:hypothetical protein [Nitrososphaerota archaeon]